MMPLKLAFRRLAKAPGFCIVSVLILALGVALSTLTFGITDSALLRPLPFPHPEQLVRVFGTSSQDAFMPLAPADAIDVREALQDIGAFAAYQTQSWNVGEPGELAELKSGLSVTADFLRVLGIQPALGRDFLSDEDQPNKPYATLITDAYWRQHFATDPHVLGKLLRIETGTYTIVGVLPPSFDEAPLWRGLSFVHTTTAMNGWRTIRAARWLNLMGRLHPNVGAEQANIRLFGMAALLAHDHPAETRGNGLRFTPLGISYVQSQAIYWLLTALAGLVLVIACANLGVVQLARTFARRGELAIRIALGARRLGLITELAAESLVIALAGTVFGVLAVRWGNGLIGHWLGWAPPAVDVRVITYAALLGVLAMAVFGFVPAWLASDAKVNDVLKSSSAQTTGGRSRRLKVALIVGQIGLAMMLVSTAFSFVAGVRTFLTRERGWVPQGLVTGVTRIGFAWVLKEQANPTLVSRLHEKLGAIPGVRGLSGATGRPLYGGTPETPVYVADVGPVALGQEPRAQSMAVDADFFRVLHIPLREGRGFSPQYRRTDAPVAIVSAAFARRFWPKGSALGRRVRLNEKEPWREIIGVVGNVSLAVGYDRAASTEQIYQPVEETSGPWYNYILETPLPATLLERSLRRSIATIDPNFVVTDIGDVPQILENFAIDRGLLVFLTTFAGAGLLIALIGLYGMMSQMVNERRREIGIRMAVGADGRRVLALMLVSGGRLLAYGILVGFAASFAAAVVLLRAMPELPVPGFWARLAVAGALVVVGLAACYLPSRRATRLNPVDVLRAE